MLPILLGVFSLVLIAGTAHIIFFQLSGIQDSLREMTDQIISCIISGPENQTAENVTYSLSWNTSLTCLMLVASLGCAVCWFLLIYRLAEDARCAGGSLMRMNPGECVLSFFLPVVNLWRPLKALLGINAALSPDNRTGGAILIWTSWAINVPITLLTFLYTFLLPLVTFRNVFQRWSEDAGNLNQERLHDGIQSILLSAIDPIIYNGIVFMLGILFSTLMALYLDFRSRKAISPATE